MEMAEVGGTEAAKGLGDEDPKEHGGWHGAMERSKVVERYPKMPL